MLNLPKNKIKLIASDFDGVLTDGGLYVTSEGGSFKKISYKDIMGVSSWLKSGGKFAIISGDTSVMIDVFATKLKIEDVFQGVHFFEKREKLEGLINKYNLSPDEVCYVGDDINDIEPLKLAGFGVCPFDANYKVKEIDDIIISNTKGGEGLIREIIDSILD